MKKDNNCENQFLDFVITPEKLENLTRDIMYDKKDIQMVESKKVKSGRYIIYGLMWFFLFFTLATAVLSHFGLGSQPYFIIPLLSITILVFFADWIVYRMQANKRYKHSLYLLKQLSDEKQLHEKDIRGVHKDNDRHEDQLKSQRRGVGTKGEIIDLVLDKFNFKGKTVLNVGCGGELHGSASEPYFNRGYKMIGVDIFVDYLKQFKREFNTDVIFANALHLPFKNNTFDIVNLTDVVGCLHNPLVGLKDAQRVLNQGAIVLTTGNRCSFSLNCINPFIFVEKVIGVYYDKILPPRSILCHWMDFKFYYTNFSRNEIMGLLRCAGFEIIFLSTYFTNKKLTDIFRKIPILNLMCGEFIIVGKKER